MITAQSVGAVRTLEDPAVGCQCLYGEACSEKGTGFAVGFCSAAVLVFQAQGTESENV